MTDAKRKTLKRSTLQDIDGIGEKKAKALLAHFRSLSAIKSADVGELAAVKGISQSDAERIAAHFADGESSGKQEGKLIVRKDGLLLPQRGRTEIV